MNLPEEETQRKIHNLIANNPGLYLSRIAEILDMNITSVQYHLQSLEEKRIITISDTSWNTSDN